MLNSLITSKTRIKLLIKFFLNSQTTSYLRNLEQEFGESSNAIRVELNRLENAKLLNSEFNGNRKYFSANINHPLFKDINSIVKNVVGIDKIIDEIVVKTGNLKIAYVTGELAKGIDSQILDLVLIGNNIDMGYIEKLISKTEKIINRKIRHLVLNQEQMSEYFKNKPVLLIWQNDKF